MKFRFSIVFFLFILIPLNPLHGDPVANNLHIKLENSLGTAIWYNFTNFETTYSSSGSTVEITTSYSAPRSQVDALLISRPLFEVENSLVDFASWFKDDQARLLWVSGDSDFGDSFHPNIANTILEKVGSHIRISDEQVTDPVYNDGQAYRLISNSPHDDGEINSILTNGVQSAIFHGSAPLFVKENGVSYHPEDIAIEGIEVIMSTSNESITSDVSGDIGFYQTTSQNASVPLMMIEEISDEHYVIVSGEILYSDYKRMYDTETERGVWGEHDGKTLVDNVFTWFETVKEDGNDSFLPVMNPILAITSVMLVLTARYINRNRSSN